MVTEATAAIPRRIEFETTLDDYVDANIRMAGRTKTFRRQRAVYRWFTGLVSGAPLIAPAVLSEGFSVSGGMAMWIVAGVGVLFGALVGSISGRYFDWRIRRHYRRVCGDLLKDASATRFELELRQAGVWTRCRGHRDPAVSRQA